MYTSIINKALRQDGFNINRFYLDKILDDKCDVTTQKQLNSTSTIYFYTSKPSIIKTSII